MPTRPTSSARIRAKTANNATSDCNSCQLLWINGIKCHEHGCPDAWRDEWRECAWCGCRFQPEHKRDTLCSQDCAESFFN